MELGRPRTAPGAGGKPVQLEQVPLARLLFALLHQRFTGTLQLEQPDPAGTRTIWLSGGMPIFTDWVSATQALGEVLVAEGILAPEDLAQALRAMASQGGRLGPVLLSLGVIDDARLAEGLRRQCARKLVEAFTLRRGEVFVTPGEFDGPAMGKVNTLELIFAGVLAHYDEARVGAEMGAALQGPLAATSALARYTAHFRFGAADQAILERLQHATDFDALSRTAGASRKRVAQLVFTLWACQMLRVGAAAQAAEATAAPAPTPAPARAAAPAAAPAARARAAAPGGAPTRPMSAAQRVTGKPAPTRPVPASPAPAPAPAPTPTPPTAEIPAADDRARPAEVDNDTFLRELGELEARLAKGAHAFELLGVPLDAGKREVRRAFGDLSRKFHPDAMAARGLLDLRERVGNVFAALSEAQVLLSDEHKREQLKDAIQRGVSPTQAGADATAMARAAFESEMLAREGDKYLKAGRFDRALEHYNRALALTKDEPDLRAAEAWCSYNLSSKARADAVRAEKILAEVVAEAPLIARAHYFRGLVLKDLGAVDPAIAALTKAAQLDPHLIDAERQARALRLAKPGAAAAAATPTRKGLFGGKKQ